MFEGILFAAPGSVPATGAALVFGLMIGSFLNVVVHRTPRILDREWWINVAEYLRDAEGWKRAFGDDTQRPESIDQAAGAVEAQIARLAPLTLARPRSSCPSCGHQIRWYENVPVFGWLSLRGRCSQCKTPISIRYPIVELLTGLLSGFIIWKFGSGATGISAVAFAWLLIALTFIDADTQLLPDDLTYPLLWLGLLVNMQGVFVPLPEAVIGAAAGYLSLWSIYWLFKLTTGKEGMGYGDFKLLGALGAWLGWKMLPVIVLLSSFVGTAVGVSMILFARHGRDKPIPFGPYLAASGVIALLWGKTIVAAYLDFVL